MRETAARHALFLALMLAGAALRAITFWAYRPALIFWDSTEYLAASVALKPGGLRPPGYAAFLWLLPLENELAVVPFVQHLMGLGLALLIYVLLLRLRVKRWVAAAATVPVLFDAFQLNLEQQILTETLFQALLLGGVALLLWRREPGTMVAGGAGLLFAASVLVRTNALFAVGPALAAVLFLRAGTRPVLALLTAFIAPLAAYMLWFHSWYGIYSLNGDAGPVLYARVATLVDCDRLSLPPHERVLCPPEPLGERRGASAYRWASDSPIHKVQPPDGMTAEAVARDFSARAVKEQPLTYARAVVVDFLRGFSPARNTAPGEAIGTNAGARVEFWRFQPTYPVFRSNTHEVVRAHGDERPTATPSLARFLVGYQSFANTPGPLMFAAMVAGLTAALGIGRAKDSRLRVAAFLFAAMAVTVLLPASAIVFSWRYQLPQFVMLPPAAAIAFTAFTGWHDKAFRDEPDK